MTLLRWSCRRLWAFGIAVAAISAYSATVLDAGSQQEQLKIHGRWSLVIRDQSGAVLERRDFNNALEPTGQLTLAAVLARSRSVGEWAIVLSGSGGTSPCGTTTVLLDCGLTEGPTEMPGIDWAVGLGVGRDPTFNHMVLTGTRSATRDGVISRVNTVLRACAPGGVDCRSLTFSSASAPDAFTQVPVKAGQTIDVSVIYSFQ